MLCDIDYKPDLAEADGGIAVADLAPGTVLEVETKRHLYRVACDGDDKAFISGHPLYCPEPVLVDLYGSIGRGMRMQFEHPTFGLVTTSRVQGIRQEACPADR